MIDQHQAFPFNVSPLPSEATEISYEWDCPVQLPYYEGHFPGQAILPGVAVLDASLELTRRAWDRSLKLRKVISMKFSSTVRPGMKIRIHVKREAQNQWLTEWTDLATGENLAYLDFETASAAKL